MDSKVAIYCRVSSQMQSTDRQKDDLLAVAKRFRYSVSDNNIFIDVVTGYSLGEDRPRYSALLEQVEKGKVDTILFSELTRLGRNSTELLSEVQRLQNQGVELYFDKQDLWVKTNKQDVGSRILLAVLAITTSYEIELFAERSLSGKINKVNNGGGIGCDEKTYGYKNDENKKMVVRDDEAKIVRRIFNMYADGKSTIDICHVLNSEKIPTSYGTRIRESKGRRERKGLPPKEYRFEDTENFRWRPSAIAKILAKKLYTGHRTILFHKPQVDKLEGKQKEREVCYTYDVQLEHLRIVSDELFQRVQERLSKAKYNKNIALKHENLLKAKLVCGECGSNFSVGKQSERTYKTNPRSYKCYGRVGRVEHPRICLDGAEILQQRLDGFVLEISLTMFAMIDVRETNRKEITKLELEYNELYKLKNAIENDIEDLKKKHKSTIKRLAYGNNDDEIVIELMEEEDNSYNAKLGELTSSLNKCVKRIASNNNAIGTLRKLSESFVDVENLHEYLQNREWVKVMVDQYVDKIIIYKIHKLWNLIVVRYANGMEIWGTIKSARYKNSELLGDENCVRYRAWILLNSDHCFSYDKNEHKVCYNGRSNFSMYDCIPCGEYNYEQLDKILSDNDLIGSFPNYAFEETPL